MKKAHGLTVLALLLGTTLVGCSNTEEPDPSPSVSESTTDEVNEETMEDSHEGEIAEEHAGHDHKIREVKPGETWTPEPFVPQGSASASPVAEPEGGSGVKATDDVSLEPLD